MIEEQSEIINKCDPAEVGDSGAVPVMIIGNNNVFEVKGVKTLLPATRVRICSPKVGCVSHSLKIGDSNILEAKSFVGRSMNVSNGCIVGAGCR